MVDEVGLPFPEQIAAIRLRAGRLIPTERWTDITRNAHDRAFVVAGAQKTDLLSDFAGAVEGAIREGRSIEWFRRQFDEIVERHGWAYRGERNWRTRVIYTTNMRTSYAAGRLAQLREPALREAAPYWMYRHGGSADPRPQHLSWDRLVLPTDDPWWQTHYPPNGWGCSCYVIAVSEAQARRLGGRFGSPGADSSGAIDRGWDYMPGDAVADDLRQVVEGKITQVPAELGAGLWESVPVAVRRVQAEEFSVWFDGLLEDRRPRGGVVVVGAIEPAVIAGLAQRQMTPAVAAVAVRDADVLHTYRDAKAHQVPREWYRRLPEHLPLRQAVLLDRRGSHPALLYVYPDTETAGGRYKLVIPIDYTIKVHDAEGRRHRVQANIVQTGRQLRAQDLRKDIDSGLLEILDGAL